MATTATIAQQYAAYFAQHEALKAARPVPGESRLGSLRTEGIDALQRLGFPTASRGNEDWRFTSVAPIANTAFDYITGDSAASVQLADVQGLAPWDASWATLVFVDGRYAPGLSTPVNSQGLMATNLRSPEAAGQTLVDASIGRTALPDSSGFIAANTAFIDDGAVVVAAANAGPVGTVHLVFVTTDNASPQVTYPRSLVVAGANTELTVLESYVGMGDGNYFTNAVTEIVLGDGAHVRHNRYLHESPEAFHIGSTRVAQGRDSSFFSTSFSRGCRVGRNDLRVSLDQPGAECDLRGLYFTDGRQHIDNHINVDHASGQTASAQYYKGILADNSRAVFSGTTLIRQDSQKSTATQADKNLLLSEGARVNTKPSLVIYADDVQAAHGATAGAIPEEQVFYMLARGLDMETATSLLIKGFANEIIDTISLDGFRTYLENYFEKSVPRYRFQGFGKARVFGGPAERVA
jgi:Fe-S cluster assembly protein SufD